MMAKSVLASAESDPRPRRSGWGIFHTLISIELLLLTATLTVSIYSQSINIQRQHEMKMVDLMTHFQNRYDVLMWEVAPAVDEVEDAQSYFSRYWNLQLEQYEYWQEGLIEDDIYAYWMGLRRAVYNDSAYRPFRTFPDYTFQQGWVFARADLHVEADSYGFDGFMREVMTGDRPINEIMLEYKRPAPGFWESMLPREWQK